MVGFVIRRLVLGPPLPLPSGRLTASHSHLALLSLRCSAINQGYEALPRRGSETLQSVLLCSLTGSCLPATCSSPPPCRPWAAPKEHHQAQRSRLAGQRGSENWSQLLPDTPAPPISAARPSDCQSGTEDQRVLPPILQIRKPAQTGKRASNAEWGPGF